VELRLFGPPGTGKTSTLAHRIGKAVKKFGSDAVMVSSFTRAASEEIASRGIPVDKNQVGTLHSFCFHALNRPEIAETRVKEFNEAVPYFAISGERASNMDDPYSSKETEAERRGKTKNGDALMARAQRFRAKLIPEELWPRAVRAFHRRWCDWKEAEGLMDFTDMIERGIEELDVAPGNPQVGFIDEAQDFTLLSMKLIRQWAKSMDYILLAGDDDQLLYNFAGATPDVLLEPALPEKQIQILEKSWRVPQAVYRVAERWINKVKERQPKNYLPTAEPGAVLFSQGNIAQPNLFMKKVEHYVDRGESVMILASCSYMLQATIKHLRSVGLPFWNPFRKTNGAWNPFSKRKGCNMAQDRLLAFTNPTLGFPPVWSIEDLVKWVDPLQSKGTVLRGAKDRPKLHMEAEWEMPENDSVSYRIRLMEYFPEEIIDELFVQLHNGPDPNWFMNRVLKSKLPVFQFPFKVMKKRGEEALQNPPLVTIGTVHSVKGGEADHVFLMPDLSMAGSREWVKTGRSKDAIYRMFYVGFTRARKTLHLCRPATSYSVNFSQFNDLARKN